MHTISTYISPVAIGEVTEMFGQRGRTAFLLAMQMQGRHPTNPQVHHEDRDTDYWVNSGFEISHLTLVGK